MIPIEQISKNICFLRKQQVLLDKDMAELYGVETRQRIQAVKRNLKRSPEDFMFQLSKQEFKILRSQNVISSWVVVDTLLIYLPSKGLPCYHQY